ncbi:MAG: 2-oxo acid dehydrogenase subunit E2 [Acidobacteria bacterium]|nr:2-oxo acid dehydrogenase subunit E2 [Acidobacteriota bacterium]
MSTPVVMPQMGESIAEGTIVRWIKKVGDTVDRDEPLFEISTDKVDAEIPSPTAGVLLEITVKEGETVPIHSVVATIGEAGSKPAAATAPSASAADAAPARPASPAPSAGTGTAGLAVAAPAAEAEAAKADGRAQRSSPLVRRIAKEHGVDIGHIAGSGAGGRVTKHDILEFIEKGPAVAPAVASKASASAASAATARPAAPVHAPAPVARMTGDRIEPMSVMRKKIAEHMVFSKHTSPHVYSVFEVNYSRGDQIRRAKKDEYERQGAKLTFTSFIAKAVTDCLRRHPVLNASIDGDNVIYRAAVNLGVAVSLEHGLIVPVVKGADEKNLLGLSRAIQDVADRARAKKLNPDEVQGGTFTITNPGNLGAQFGLPVINQPQVAILCVGTIEKRPVVIDDMIGIRMMGYLTLGFDHRLVDGVVADEFLADLKKSIEQFDAAQA